MTPVLRHVAAAAAVSLCLALGACGGDDTITVPGTDGVSVDTTDEDFEINSEDGSVTGGSGKLPAGFPEDDVPLVDGDIQSGVAIDQAGQKGWSVTIVPEGADHADAVSLLTDAGFTQLGEFNAGGSLSAQLTSDAWSVLVGTISVDGSTTVSYTVAPADA